MLVVRSNRLWLYLFFMLALGAALVWFFHEARWYIVCFGLLSIWFNFAGTNGNYFVLQHDSFVMVNPFRVWAVRKAIPLSETESIEFQRKGRQKSVKVRLNNNKVAKRYFNIEARQVEVLVNALKKKGINVKGSY